MTDDVWIPITALDSPFEEEFNARTGAHRHRRLVAAMRPGMRHAIAQASVELPWQDGPAPRSVQANIMITKDRR